jgi:hypothetical protein
MDSRRHQICRRQYKLKSPKPPLFVSRARAKQSNICGEYFKLNDNCWTTHMECSCWIGARAIQNARADDPTLEQRFACAHGHENTQNWAEHARGSQSTRLES